MLQTPVDSPPSRQGPSDILRDRLARYVGPYTARTALQTFAKKELGIAPEAVRIDQVPQLLDALGPILRTLLGKGADDLVTQLKKEFEL